MRGLIRRFPAIKSIKNTEGWELIPELRTFAENRMVFEKGTFGSSALAHFTAKNLFDEVELIGLCTDICVISNAMLIKAACPETIVRVCESCCAGVTPQSHKNALEAMKMCQIEIV